MSALGDVPSIEEPDFAASVVRASPVVLRLSGSAEGAATAALETMIHRLHEALVADGVREIVIELRELEFMNATAFNTLLGWLTQVSELPAEQRYHLRFRSNPAVLWQHRSLQRLSCFATDLVRIERERGPA